MHTWIVDYLVPSDLDEACRLLEQDDAVALAGGTELLARPPTAGEYKVVDIGHVLPSGVSRDGGACFLGAAVTFQRLCDDPLAGNLAGGILSRAARSLYSRNVRNMATLGGHVAAAVSSADLIPVLLAMDAAVELRAGGGAARTVPLEDFLLDHRKTALRKGELIYGLRVPGDVETRAGSFLKLGRTRSDIAIVNAACTLSFDGERVEKARVAVGAASPCAMRVKEAERLLVGRSASEASSEEVLAELARLVSGAVRPIDDHRASAEYRRRTAGVLAARAVAEALERSRR